MVAEGTPVCSWGVLLSGTGALLGLVVLCFGGFSLLSSVLWGFGR